MAKYEPEMYSLMCRTFWESRSKSDKSVEDASKAALKALERVYPDLKGNHQGIRAKCYELRRNGYDWETDSFKAEVKPPTQQVVEQIVTAPKAGSPKQMIMKMPNVGIEITIMFTDK
jgi:hypothetical protein